MAEPLPQPLRAQLVRWTAAREYVSSAELATEFLSAGFEDDDLCVAATLSADEAEAHGLVSAVLERLGLALRPADCLLETAHDLALEIVSGRVEVEAGAQAIWSLAFHDTAYPDSAWHLDAGTLCGFLDDLEGVRRNFGGARSLVEVERVVAQQRDHMREIAARLLGRRPAASG